MRKVVVKPSCVTLRSVARARRIRIAGLALAMLMVSPGCSSWRAAQLYQSGTRALDAGAPERAVAELEAATQLEPQRSEIRNHLGLAYAASGDVAAAEASFEKAIAIDCENGAARRNLAALRAGKLGLASTVAGDTTQRLGEPGRTDAPEEQ